ncbi:MAG: response regulator [Ignavibacteria bacterium]|nr:response regulator [Ignavibacteria bacterium]
MESGRKPGILLVEDETEIRILLAEVFRIEDYEIFQAADGREALTVFEANKEKIDMLITDLGLPHIGGIDVIKHLREAKQDLLIIGSSGYGRADIREEVIEAGGDEFMPKPYVTKLLIEQVRNMLEQSSKQKQ